jgi:hypothetical protein
MNSEIIVFNIIGTPVMYIGKVVLDDIDSGRLVLTEAVMGINEKGSVQLVAVPSADKHSHIEIPTGQVPGIKIRQPDEDLVKAYENAILRAYSRLTLA